MRVTLAALMLAGMLGLSACGTTEKTVVVPADSHTTVVVPQSDGHTTVVTPPATN